MRAARRSRLPSWRPSLAVVLLLGLAGCAYFNTFYNANRLFEEAERQRTAKGGSADKAAGQYDACIKKCHDLLRYHPKSKYVDDALFMIGVSHFHRGEYVQAQGSLQDLLERFPDSDLAEKAWFHIGLASLALGDTGGASAAFETLERNYPSSSYRVDAAYRTAEALLEAKDNEATRKALREFIAKHPDSRHVGAAQLRIAATYHDDLQFDLARAEYQRALELDLTDEQRFDAEMQIALTKRDHAALILDDPALYTEQDLPPGLRLQMEEAMADSTADVGTPATALPESLLAQRNQANALLDEATQDLERLRKRAAKFNADLLLGIEHAVATALRGDPDEALANLDVIARTDPRSDMAARAQYEMAEIHRRYGRWSKALEGYDAAQRGTATSEVAILGKKKGAAIRARTAAMEQLRDAPEVQRRWRVARGLETPRQGEKDPRSQPDSVQVLVEIEMRREELAAQLLRVTELDLFDLEQPWLALRECQQLLADYPGSMAAPRAALGIAWIYDRHLSEPERALAAYERVLRDYPTSPQARQAEEFATALRGGGAPPEPATAPGDSMETAPVDTTMAAPHDSVGTAPVDTTMTAPGDSMGTAPVDTTMAAPRDSTQSP